MLQISFISFTVYLFFIFFMGEFLRSGIFFRYIRIHHFSPESAYKLLDHIGEPTKAYITSYYFRIYDRNSEEEIVTRLKELSYLSLIFSYVTMVVAFFFFSLGIYLLVSILIELENMIQIIFQVFLICLSIFTIFKSCLFYREIGHLLDEKNGAHHGAPDG